MVLLSLLYLILACGPLHCAELTQREHDLLIVESAKKNLHELAATIKSFLPDLVETSKTPAQNVFFTQKNRKGFLSALNNVDYLLDEQNKLQQLLAEFFRQFKKWEKIQEERERYEQRRSRSTADENAQERRLQEILVNDDIAINYDNLPEDCNSAADVTFIHKLYDKNQPYLNDIVRWLIRHRNPTQPDFNGATQAVRRLHEMDKDLMGTVSDLNEFKSWLYKAKMHIFFGDPDGVIQKLLYAKDISKEYENTKKALTPLALSTRKKEAFNDALASAVFYIDFLEKRAFFNQENRTIPTMSNSLKSLTLELFTENYPLQEATQTEHAIKKVLKSLSQEYGIDLSKKTIEAKPTEIIKSKTKSEKAKEKKAKLKKKAKAGSSSNKPEESESEDSDSEDTLVHALSKKLECAPSQKQPAAQAPEQKKIVVLSTQPDARLEDFEKWLEQQSGALSKAWGPDLFESMKTWTNQLSAIGSQDVVIVTDPALRRKTTLYIFNEMHGREKQETPEDYPIAPRVKKYLSHYLDAPQNNNAQAHTVDPFIIDMVRKKGILVNYIDRKSGNPVRYKALLVSVEETRDGAARKIDGVIQASWDKDNTLFHLLLKPAQGADDFKALAQFLAGKEIASLPQVLVVDDLE